MAWTSPFLLSHHDCSHTLGLLREGCQAFPSRTLCPQSNMSMDSPVPPSILSLLPFLLFFPPSFYLQPISSGSRHSLQRLPQYPSHSTLSMLARRTHFQLKDIDSGCKALFLPLHPLFEGPLRVVSFWFRSVPGVKAQLIKLDGEGIAVLMSARVS